MMNNKVLKRFLTGVLSLAVAVAGLGVMSGEAQAATDSAKVEYQKVEFDTFKTKIDAQEAPDYVKDEDDDSNIGYLFAGWYEVAADDAVGSSLTTSDGVTAEYVYAKFIPSTLAGIAVQVDMSTDENDRNMRVVSLIDSGRYQKFGVNVVLLYDNNGVRTEWEMYKYNTDYVAENGNRYSGLYQYDAENNRTTRTPASVFGALAEDFYFTTVSITNIPSTYHDATLAVQPYWVTADGTYVAGMEEFNRISDYDNGVRNISVNIKDATNIAAGMLDITLASAFEGATVEVENGRVFDEVTSYQGANSTTVRCIGNVKDITTNATNPNSVFVNLRITGASSITMGTNTFEITIPEIGGFSTNKEEPAKFSVWNILY